MAKMNSEELRTHVIERLNRYIELLHAAQMDNEAAQAEEKVKEYMSGLFSVMFTGDFSAGKSTTLNALMRQNLLTVSINPETPVITKIINGEDSDFATIKYRDKNREGEIIPLSEFAEKYRLEFVNEGKFLEVSYVELKRQLRTSTVVFVDSPGLGNSTTDDRAANEFAEKADAIVFMIHATKAMDQAAKDYVERRFRRRHLKNVFFLINWYNMVQEQDEEKFRKKIQYDLYDVFTDENGNFDQALYDSRVFFVDALTSFCARTGTNKKVRRGAKWIEVPVPTEEDEYSGIPEFEAALYKFLEADDRDINGYRGFMPLMAGMLSATREHIAEVIALSAQNITSLQAQEKEQKEKIEEINRYLQDIQTAIDDCIRAMMVNIQSAYNSFVNRLENNWDDHFSGRKINFGILDEAKIFGLKVKHKVQDIFDRDGADQLARDKEFEALMKPITSQVEEYVRSQTDKMVNEISTNCEPSVKRMANRIAGDIALIKEVKLPGFDFEKLVADVVASSKKDADSATRNFGKDSTGAADSVHGDMSLAQMLISGLLLYNFDDMLTGSVEGKKPWGTFLKESLLKEVGDMILAYVISCIFPPAWIYYVARAVWGVLSIRGNAQGIGNSIILGMKQTTKQMATDARDEVFTNLESSFENQIVYGCSELVGAIELGMKQKQKQLESLVRQREGRQFDAEQEKQKLNEIEKNMVADFNDLSKLLDGPTYTEAQIMELAAQKIS